MNHSNSFNMFIFIFVIPYMRTKDLRHVVYGQREDGDTEVDELEEEGEALDFESPPITPRKDGKKKSIVYCTTIYLFYEYFLYDFYIQTNF